MSKKDKGLVVYYVTDGLVIGLPGRSPVYASRKAAEKAAQTLCASRKASNNVWGIRLVNPGCSCPASYAAGGSVKTKLVSYVDYNHETGKAECRRVHNVL